MSPKHSPTVAALIEQDPKFLGRPRRVRRAMVSKVQRAIRKAGRAEGITVRIRRARR